MRYFICVLFSILLPTLIYKKVAWFSSEVPKSERRNG